MRPLPGILIAPLLALAASGSNAAVIHKWTDADGVTHYSDQPPPAAVTAPERIDLPTAPARAAPRGDDYYSIANQWQRMHRERIELERVRAERSRETGIESRGGDTIVIEVPESRPSVAILPRHRQVLAAPKSRAAPTTRHPFAIPGRDWPVGLHPGRNKLRGSFRTY